MFRNITPVVQNLLLINVVIYILSSFVLPVLNDWFPLFYFQSVYFKPFQFLTYMFMHADFWHLFGNMFGLLVFGPLLEQFLGPKKLLILWMACGVGAGVLYSAVNAYEIRSFEEKAIQYELAPDPEVFNRLVLEESGPFQKAGLRDFVDRYSRNADSEQYIQESVKIINDISDFNVNVTRMLGASGAFFGILIAFGMLFPNTQLFLLFPPMPVKAKYLVLFWGLYTVYNVFLNNPDDNVAHFAHLSGLVIGAILVTFWKKDRNSFY